MSYVMVPVPEEHAATVKRYVRWGGATAPSADWDESSVQELLRGFDADALTLLVGAAEAVLDAGPLTVGEAARTIGCSDREVLGLVVEVNSAMRGAGGPGLTLATEQPKDVSGGERNSDIWLLVMSHDVARFLLAAEPSAV